MIGITGQNLVINLYLALRGPVLQAYRNLKRCLIFRNKTKGKTIRTARNMAKRKLRSKMSSMKSFVFEDMSVATNPIPKTEDSIDS